MASKNIQLKNGPVTQQDLDRISTQVENVIPTSFERYYINYWNTSEYTKKMAALEVAYQLAPNRYETYPAFINYYEKQGNIAQVVFFCKKWLASGEYSSGILHWNYNMLISLDKNAILLTYRDNDTYPLWLLQKGKKNRQDVKVLNLELLLDENYQQRIFQQLDIPLFTNSRQDFITKEDYQQALTNHLLKQKKKASIYFCIAAPKSLIQPHESNLYLVGLSFKHSKKDLDNIAILKKNYEQLFLKDYLYQSLSYDVSQSIVNQYNLNYLPSFLLLHQHYKLAEENHKLQDLEHLIFKVADAGGKGTMIRMYLGKDLNDKAPFKTAVNLSHRTIENMVTTSSLLTDKNTKVYVGVTETSLAQYELFLTDLLKQKEYDKISICRIHVTNWRSYLVEEFKNAPEELLFSHGHPESPKCPVQNISYEAANLYCEWLTQVYNNLSHRKKRYKKVCFRLPTEEEWLAATSIQGLERETLYPWVNHERDPNSAMRPTNLKGCFLANFNVGEKTPIGPDEKAFLKTVEYKDGKDQKVIGWVDGLFFTGAVDAYFPNELGLYNTIGNVAEMVQEKGKAKGGSWYHSIKDCNRQVANRYDQPQPYIGFRVFMEVIEK